MALIGLFGGTFDPVHFGHLRPALDLHEYLGLDEVRLLPCNVSPHREPPLASGAQRLRMLEIAVEGHPALVVDPRELQRPPPSYTLDSLEALRGEQPGATLVLAMGADAYAAFETWHGWRRILELAHLAVLTRPGYPLPVDDPRLGGPAAALATCPAGLVVECPVTALPISASDLRRRLAAGRDVSFFLPEGVRRYLERHALYLPGKGHYARR